MCAGGMAGSEGAACDAVPGVLWMRKLDQPVTVVSIGYPGSASLTAVESGASE